MMHWDGWFGMGFMWVFWLVLLAVIIILAARWATVSRADRGRESSPEEILRRRYARGEIDRQEFEDRMRDLRGG